MARKKIPYLVEKRNGDGSARWYWQPSGELRAAGWPMRRLYAENWFAAAQQAEEINARVASWRRGEKTPAELARIHMPGTLSAVVSDYQGSQFYRRLRESTRRSYDYAMRMLEDWGGKTQVAAIRKRNVRKLYEELQASRGDGAAHTAVAVLRVLMSHAIELELISINPARELRLTHDRKTEPRLWSRQDVTDFVNAADALGWHSIGTAVLLNEWLGQRAGDVLSLPRTAWRDGQIFVNQSKTGARVALPVGMVPHLAERLADELERQRRRKVEGTTLLLCETTGQRWHTSNFRHRFGQIRDAAAKGVGSPILDPGAALPAAPHLAGLQFRFLRHTAITRMGEAGCSTIFIASVSGHNVDRVERILDVYLVRTDVMAEQAFRRRLEHEAGGDGE